MEGSDFNFIDLLANSDVTALEEAQKSYGDSWRSRGGVGAFMMLARKWDRIENQVSSDNYDIFKTITTELWYLDHGKIDRYEYSADNIVHKQKKLNDRAVAMTTATEFPAKPSTFGCKWCYFGKEKMCSERYE
jgi:hypothetical protein